MRLPSISHRPPSVPGNQQRFKLDNAILNGIKSKFPLPLITSITRHDLETSSSTNTLKLVYKLDISTPEKSVGKTIRMQEKDMRWFGNKEVKLGEYWGRKRVQERNLDKFRQLLLDQGPLNNKGAWKALPEVEKLALEWLELHHKLPQWTPGLELESAFLITSALPQPQSNNIDISVNNNAIPTIQHGTGVSHQPGPVNERITPIGQELDPLEQDPQPPFQPLPDIHTFFMQPYFDTPPGPSAVNPVLSERGNEKNDNDTTFTAVASQEPAPQTLQTRRSKSYLERNFWRGEYEGLDPIYFKGKTPGGELSVNTDACREYGQYDPILAEIELEMDEE
ncbi:hypothetical protein HD553DRAFT_321871 [Filobasidium floriforme]|uniref:uncharacterized protein n=1 Tax=Filobasidium floriforme TaxID=5210 RepID=UPI001E8DE9D9|nr:uncharacterized protein HD553DRAFT_321871 [Filobasidium floriforme]KAH8089832.1 hypothetical protein HD553DRAFT_321871 [Filobasidium floriforme]